MGTLPPAPEPDPSSTRFLLARHHAGDASALGDLLARELPSIRELVHRRLGGALRRRMDTNDMVQEVCLLVLRKGPHFLVRDPACFRGLMSRLVHNAMISSFRHYGFSLEQERDPAATTCIDFDHPSQTTAPPDQASAAEEREIVRVALLLLDPLDAEVLRLRDEVELSFVEIGRRLEQNHDAVRMRHRRAIRKLENIVLRLRNGQLQAVLEELDREASAEPAG